MIGSQKTIPTEFLGILTALVILVAVPRISVGADTPRRISDEAIDRAGEMVMNGNDFRSVRRRVLEQAPTVELESGFLSKLLSWVGDGLRTVLEAIGRFLYWLFSGLRSTGRAGPPPGTMEPDSGGGFDLATLNQILKITAIVAVIAVLTVIIVMVIRAADRNKRQRISPDGELDDLSADVLIPPGELAASTYETRALAFAEKGNYRAAIRELLLGSMSWIERSGYIRFRRGLTNRDYVRTIWRNMEKRSAFLTTATQFEYVYFGRRAPTQEMFETCLSSFRNAFHEEETPTAAV